MHAINPLLPKSDHYGEISSFKKKTALINIEDDEQRTSAMIIQGPFCMFLAII